MNIEFHSPGTDVKQWTINYLKEKLMEFRHNYKEISKVEVHFHEEDNLKDGNKVCDIEVTVYANSFFIRRHSDSYELAARRAIEGLTEKIDEQIKKLNEPPDEITTTVFI